ncbi:MAG: butyrate kinase [Lachnospiraceae bacterium]|nr:butyrate kinase [Lachnospiraceae bacterium]
MEKILVMNPGSTSTKIAVYEDEKALFVENIAHTTEELAQFDEITDQFEFRKNTIIDAMSRHGIALSDLTAIVSRCGLLPPIEAGAYKVNEDMVWQMKYNPQNNHASNVGAPIAYALSQELDIPAFVYDGITVDEMIPLTKITGFKDMRRKALGHNLNMRAAAKRWEKESGKPYSEANLVIAHLGGGITESLHSKGRIIDFVSDEEGPFSPERTGGLPLFQVVDMAFSGEYDQKSMMKKIKGAGGLNSHLGTNDTRNVEKMIEEGDEYAALVYEAMALSVAKHIAALSATVNGEVDAIILTGGIANSEKFTKMVSDRVQFIAPVVIYAGENEMDSLAFGALRVLRGEEEAKNFTKVEGKI